MVKNIITNKISFIDFLKKEFGFNSSTFLAMGKKESKGKIQSAAKSKKSKLQWSLIRQPRNLANVLELKIEETGSDGEAKKPAVDFEDESVLSWRQKFNISRQHLLSKKMKKKEKKIGPLSFRQPHFNVPGIFSYCRENDSCPETPVWSTQAAFLVFVSFAVATASLLYLIGNGGLGGGNIEKSIVLKKEIIKPDDKLLANFIKVNRDWLDSQFANSDTLAVKMEDVFGQIAGATEINNDLGAAEERLVENDFFTNELNILQAKFYNYLKELENKQKDASIFLSGFLRNIIRD